MKNPFERFIKKREQEGNESGDKFSFLEYTQQQLEIKDINKILFYSFFISQGDILLQLCLLKYASCFYGKQGNISVNEVRKAFINKNIDLSSELILEKNSSHPKVSPGLLAEEIKEADKETSMFDAFTSLLLGGDFQYRQYHTVEGNIVFGVIRQEDLIDNFNPSWILNSIILWDREFLINRGGRQNRKDENSGDNSIKDRYMSVFVSFVVKEGKTNISAFDNMFEKLRSYYKNNHLDRLDSVRELINFYNLHHPESVIKV